MKITNRIRDSIAGFKKASGQKPARVQLDDLLEVRLASDSSLDPQVVFDKPTNQWFVDGTPVDVVMGLGTDVRCLAAEGEPV